jgi:TetR/AcrR family transcriptional regulator
MNRPTDRDAPSGADRILTAARQLFAVRGFAGVSIQQVADTAGVCKANVFHHFASKQALYRAVLRHSADEFRQLLGRLESPEQESLATFTRAHMDHLYANQESVGMFLRLLAEPQATPQRRLAEEIAAESLDGIIELLEQRRSAGTLPPAGDCSTLALTLLGGNLLHFLLRHVLPRTRFAGPLQEPGAFAEQLAGLLATPVPTTLSNPR